jgi:hypothetical protein
VTRTKSESEKPYKTTTKTKHPQHWKHRLDQRGTKVSRPFIVASAMESKKHENHTQSNRKNTTPQHFKPKKKQQKPQRRPKEPQN